MPIVVLLGNIRIRIYLMDTGRHHRPHFHAASPEGEIVVGLPDLDVIAGSLPPAARRTVLDWSRENLPVLIEAWNLANPGTPTQIDR